MCAVVPVLLAGSMDLVVIGDKQAGAFWNWNLFHDPFTFITFWVYFTCATASVNRAPFDLAEAESELVAGFHTEYSGLRWSFFFMAEYGSMLAVSLLASILFLGGWHGPIPVSSFLGWTFDNGFWQGIAGNVLGTLNMLFKGLVGVTVMMWVRWTLPRLRIDQVITTCLKYCVPIAAVAFLGATWWQYQWPNRQFFGVLEVPAASYRVAESWKSTESNAPAGPASSTTAALGVAQDLRAAAVHFGLTE
jgi:NADH-quinone oxidoreductase subunit H